MRLAGVFFFAILATAVASNAAGETWMDQFLLLRSTQTELVPFLSSKGTLEPTGLYILPMSMVGTFVGSAPPQTTEGSSWESVGLNANAKLGLKVSAPWISMTLQPTFWFAENDATLPPVLGRPPYGDAHRGVWDHPIRMGDTALSRFGFDGSSVEARVGPAVLEFGVPLRRWGPSLRNNLLLSSNGPGVPSLSFGVNPIGTQLGTIEAHYIAGFLRPSGWQAESAVSGERLWTGIYLAYSFPFLPDLSLSAGRTVLSSWDELDGNDFLVPLVAKYRWGPDKYDQRASVGYRWRFPSEGLELYGEWGRNDYSPKLLAWFQNLERTQAYVLGLRKSFETDVGTWAIEGELASAFLGPEALINKNGYIPYGLDFYTHWFIKEGYTIEGQDLGAAVGNGNALSFTIAWLGRDVAAKVDFRRWVKDYSVLLATLDPTGEFRINVQYEAESEVRWTLGPVTWIVGFTPVYEISPYFEADKQVSSFRAKLGLEYQP